MLQNFKNYFFKEKKISKPELNAMTTILARIRLARVGFEG